MENNRDGVYRQRESRPMDNPEIKKNDETKYTISQLHCPPKANPFTFWSQYFLLSICEIVILQI